MRSAFLSAAMVASLIAPALAQPSAAPGYPQQNPPPGYASPAYAAPAMAAPTAVPQGADPATGARPGNVIGTGMSLPMSDHASNIDQSDMRSPIAPNLPSPAVGPDSSPAAYLRAAEGALASGRTGEAQQALEQAQTRLLDRSVAYGETSNPSDNPAVAQISGALHALAAGDRGRCMELIQSAIPAAQAMAQ